MKKIDFKTKNKIVIPKTKITSSYEKFYIRMIKAQTLSKEEIFSKFELLESLEIEVWKEAKNQNFLPRLICHPIVKRSGKVIFGIDGIKYTWENDNFNTTIEKLKKSSEGLNDICLECCSFDNTKDFLKLILKDLKTPNIESLSRKIKNIKNCIIENNLRLPFVVSKMYKRPGVESADLVQYGMLGLIKAVDRFEYRKGFLFSTYATWWIRTHIGRGTISNENSVRVPVPSFTMSLKIENRTQKLKTKLGREPTLSELSEETNYNEARLKRAFKRKVRGFFSLDQALKGRSESDINSDTYLDFLKNDQVFGEKRVDYNSLKKALNKLTSRQRLIIKYRFGFIDGDEWILEDIGKILGVTRECIRLHQKKAIKRLREYMNTDES